MMLSNLARDRFSGPDPEHNLYLFATHMNQRCSNTALCTSNPGHTDLDTDLGVDSLSVTRPVVTELSLCPSLCSSRQLAWEWEHSPGEL